MYNILPDLLKIYYVSLSAVLVAGIVIGIAIGWAWFEHEHLKRQQALIRSVAEAEIEINDEVARRLLRDCDLP